MRPPGESLVDLSWAVVCLHAAPLHRGTSPLAWSGMCDDSLRHVYKAVVLSKLLYASPAWWGFASAADKQRLEALTRRAVRSGLFAADDPSFLPRDASAERGDATVSCPSVCPSVCNVQVP